METPIIKVLAVQGKFTTKYYTYHHEYHEWADFFNVLCQPHIQKYVIYDIFPSDFELFEDKEYQLENALHTLETTPNLGPFDTRYFDRIEAFDMLWKFAEEGACLC